MSSEEYQMQNIYRYSRKSYKKSRRHEEPGSQWEEPPNTELELPRTPRTQGLEWNYFEPSGSAAGCSCDPSETDREIASILHKKCPVISLAEQQLQRLLEGTEQLLCENDRCCRSVYDFLRMCRHLLASQHKALYVLLLLTGMSFFVGVILGSASCGTYLSRFESPILSCIDAFFVSDPYTNTKAKVII